MSRRKNKEYVVYIYTMEYYPYKNEILSRVTIWMDLEGITLSEISQGKTNTILFHLYMDSKKQNK